ncbi:MAG: hypothetical protein LBU99_04280 [Spirochaetaceae bacterium]|jgi:predicted nuclease of restriction endonuclease-like RecB superfamily|nr:hypothetical protein [Spirochaetaceae bacterium]
MVQEQTVQDYPGETSFGGARSGETRFALPPALTFEQVWAILQETAKRQEVYAKKWEERQQEFERQFKKDKEDFNKRLGNFTNMFGDFTESMVAPCLRDAFAELGFEFQKAGRNIVINDIGNKIHMEIDVMLENGDKVMLVEVKTKLTKERINKHIERLEKMRKYADLKGDTRRFWGGVAGVIMEDDVKEYALEQGFYLIEPADDLFRITMPEGKPREW